MRQIEFTRRMLLQSAGVTAAVTATGAFSMLPAQAAEA